MKETALTGNEVYAETVSNKTLKTSNHSIIDYYDKLKQSNCNIQKIAFYAGSFDPFTNGHWAIVCEALAQFDKLYIGIGVNPDKKTLLNPKERVESIQKTIREFIEYCSENPQYLECLNKAECITYQRLCQNPNVIEVLTYEGLTVDTALKLKANVLVRGVRNENDTTYEDSLTKINQILVNVREAKLESLILKPENQAEIAHISSSAVKSLCRMNEYIALQGFVSPSIHNQISEKYLKSVFQQTAQYFGVTDSDKIDAAYQTILKTKESNFITMSYTSFLINHINIQNALRGPIKTDIKHLLILSAFYRGAKKCGVSNDDIKAQLSDFIGGDITPVMDLITVQESDKANNQLTALQYLILASERKLETYSQQHPMYMYVLNTPSLQSIKVTSADLLKRAKPKEFIKQYN